MSQTTCELFEAGSVTSAALSDGAVTAAKLAAGAGGKILQVVQTVKTDTFSDTQSPQFTDWVDVTGLSVSITPASTSNKILVLAQVSVVGAATQPFAARLLRGASTPLIADTSGSRTPSTVSSRHESGQALAALPITFLDSPSTTSATTYKIQVAAESTVYVNRTGSDSDASSFYRSTSSIIAMEVAG